MGTQVLTGLVIMATIALGHCLAMFVAMSLIMPALTLKRSSRVIPGLRGTPAGITTTSEPWKRRDKNKYYIAYGMYFDLFIFYYTNKILWYDKRRSLTTVGKKIDMSKDSPKSRLTSFCNNQSCHVVLLSYHCFVVILCLPVKSHFMASLFMHFHWWLTF